GENVPNLIAQRCLEALTFIVSYNEASVTYFLMEHENNIGLKRTNSRKGKEKQKSVTSKYPVVILLSLLDRQVFIRNTSLMEQLMTLLSFVLRPLSSIAKNNQPNTTTTNTSNTTNNNVNGNQPVFKPEEHQDYLSRCFLLQCLTELLSSYPSCKIRRNSVNVYNNNSNTKSKPFLLNHLLNEFLPYGCITPSTDIEMRKRYGQSKWTTYTL
ncbi:8397_t:CDS:2, partial [Entrophospora sp. SA101]